jgi:hypothetical protein
MNAPLATSMLIAPTSIELRFHCNGKHWDGAFENLLSCNDLQSCYLVVVSAL